MPSSALERGCIHVTSELVEPAKYVYKTEMDGRAELKQALTIFIPVPHSMRTKRTKPGGIVRTNTGLEVTSKQARNQEGGHLKHLPPRNFQNIP